MKRPQEKIQDRDMAISFIREVLDKPHFILDTETTGKNRNYDQIVQWAVRTYRGKEYKSLAKVTIPVSPGAYDVHHISNVDLENAPSIIEIMDRILYGGAYAVSYNVPFDAGVLKNSLRASKTGLEIDIDNCKEFIPCDIMRLSAKFRGEWSEKYNDYRWRKLEYVCEEFGIPLDLPLHDALSDATLTERIMYYLAEQRLSTEN